MNGTSDEIVSILREEISQYDAGTHRDETGTVLNVGDGIATVYGLRNAVYGELVEFETGVRGMKWAIPAFWPKPPWSSAR